MKKMFLGAAMFALLATGCAKEEPQTAAWQPGTVQFEITAGAETRAFYSEEALAPTINNVNVYAFLNDGSDNYVYAQTIAIPGWVDGVAFTLTDAAANTLAAGDYKFVALGRVANDLYTLPATAGLTFEDMMATVGATVNDIYSGDATQTVTAEGGRVAINMTRKVAGVMGYFANIPAEINGTAVATMKFSVNQTYTTIDMTSTGTAGTVVVATDDIITFNFTGDTIANGIYTTGNATETGATQLPNSYLDGQFVAPGSVTFTLGLYDAADVALKTWTVNGGTAVALAPNTLYSLGQKKMVNNTDGDDPDDTTDDADLTDDDRAIDLMSTQELTITITPDWDETIEYLTIQ